MELNAQAGGGGGQGEDRIDGAAAGGHLKTAMNKIAGKSWVKDGEDVFVCRPEEDRKVCRDSPWEASQDLLKSGSHNIHFSFICCSLEAGGTPGGLQELGLGSFPGLIEEFISQPSLQLHLLQPGGRKNTGRSAGTSWLAQGAGRERNCSCILKGPLGKFWTSVTGDLPVPSILSHLLPLPPSPSSQAPPPTPD